MYRTEFVIVFTVRTDTLSDMVAHMTDSVVLVHQMPFSCDRSGLPATLEKVRIHSLPLCLHGSVLLCINSGRMEKIVKYFD